MTLFLHVTRLYLTKFLAVFCLVKDLCTQKQYFTQKQHVCVISYHQFSQLCLRYSSIIKGSMLLSCIYV